VICIKQVCIFIDAEQSKKRAARLAGICGECKYADEFLLRKFNKNTDSRHLTGINNIPGRHSHLPGIFVEGFYTAPIQERTPIPAAE
jgi:hypothetical protein